MVANSKAKQDWVDELNKPEVQASLQKLIEKLPEITTKIEQAEHLLAFGQSVLDDERTLAKVKTKLEYSNIDINTLEAGFRLLEKLPLIVALTEKLETIVRFVDNVLADEKSIAYLQNSVEDHVEPLREKVEQGKALWEEVQMKAKANTQHISIFTVLKWMKDPSVQKALSYVQALIETVPKKS